MLPFETPDAGRVVLEGKDLAALDDSQRTRLRRARLGFVFQAFHLLPHLTIEKNVSLPLALNGIHDGPARERVADERARFLPDQAIEGRIFAIRKGKKDNFLVRLVRS